MQLTAEVIGKVEALKADGEILFTIHLRFTLEGVGEAANQMAFTVEQEDFDNLTVGETLDFTHVERNSRGEFESSPSV